MGLLIDEELSRLVGAEEAAFPSPIPTQIVASDEYFPEPQNARQKEVEARLKELGDRPAARQGIDRRRFFQTAAGMAAGDLGQLFAYTNIAEPRLAAALMGTLIKGLGPDHVIWGTDAVWTGSPQWQIEGLRRLEIPEDMQRKHGSRRSALPMGQ